MLKSVLGLSADLIHQPTIFPKLSAPNKRFPSEIKSVIPLVRFRSKILFAKTMLFPLLGISKRNTEADEVPFIQNFDLILISIVLI